MPAIKVLITSKAPGLWTVVYFRPDGLMEIRRSISFVAAQKWLDQLRAAA